MISEHDDRNPYEFICLLGATYFLPTVSSGCPLIQRLPAKHTQRLPANDIQRLPAHPAVARLSISSGCPLIISSGYPLIQRLPA